MRGISDGTTLRHRTWYFYGFWGACLVPKIFGIQVTKAALVDGARGIGVVG